MILNVFLPSSGTLLSAFLDENNKPVNKWALLAFLIQLLLLPIFLIGWPWAIWHGFAIWRNNHEEKKEYEMRIGDFNDEEKQNRQRGELIKKHDNNYNYRKLMV